VFLDGRISTHDHKTTVVVLTSRRSLTSRTSTEGRGHVHRPTGTWASLASLAGRLLGPSAPFARHTSPCWETDRRTTHRTPSQRTPDSIETPAGPALTRISRPAILRTKTRDFLIYLVFVNAAIPSVQFIWVTPDCYLGHRGRLSFNCHKNVRAIAYDSVCWLRIPDGPINDQSI